MAVDPNSPEGQNLRKSFPLVTMPGQQFNLLCAQISVSEASKGDFLFTRHDSTEAFIYLIDGSVSLEAEALKVETISADSNSAKFALAHQFPRKISARAINNVRYIRLNLNAFEQKEVEYEEKESVYMIGNEGSEKVAKSKGDWMSALLKSPIFQRLPAMNLQQVIMSLQEVKLEKGDVLFHQGDVGDYYYLVREGRCTLSRKASERAKEIMLTELGENETFGEDALLSGEPRSVTVTAATDMLLSRINKELFIKLIKNPALKYITYPELLHEQAKDLTPLILDVRPVNEYNETHIEGSRNIPFFSLRMHIKDLKKEAKRIIIICADGTLSEAAAFTLIKNKIDAVILKGGMHSVPKNISYTGEATFAIDDNDQKSPIFFERDDVSTADISRAIDQQTSKLDSLTPETKLDLQQENQLLKAENLRLSSELDNAKKQYRILYKQTQKLKDVLEKLKVTSKQYDNP
ncbi:MAG: cyclic nucleotide-binding domain-containing protein [Methyloprofundus sp.]|nr:cyclic nucleotide-binding domain-containing protein [Methyloprofundus sp.]MDT8425843.1 cyclic nucleotide-binding domain-containing protein [Methyloprofundus sp.]